MVTIGVDQLLRYRDLHEHRYLENIKKLIKSSVKWDYQQKYKCILAAAIVSTNEGLTENIPMSFKTSVSVTKPSSRKPLCKLSEILGIKPKSAVLRLGAAKSK